MNKVFSKANRKIWILIGGYLLVCAIIMLISNFNDGHEFLVVISIVQIVGSVLLLVGNKVGLVLLRVLIIPQIIFGVLFLALLGLLFAGYVPLITGPGDPIPSFGQSLFIVYVLSLVIIEVLLFKLPLRFK